MTNTIVWGNTAAIGDPQVYWEVGTFTAGDSIIEGGCPAGVTCDPVSIIDADPLFVDAPNGDLRLLQGSTAIDTGNNAAVPAGITTDLAGNPRILNGTVDLGAYEGFVALIYLPLALR
jgi:hypothetical protein